MISRQAPRRSHARATRPIALHWLPALALPKICSVATGRYTVRCYRSSKPRPCGVCCVLGVSPGSIRKARPTWQIDLRFRHTTSESNQTPAGTKTFP
eukprot:6563310-Prymnesium_polylepis.2